MNFTNPEILYALPAVLIPLIIHLFNFRRYKKFYFSNVALLKEINIETRKKSRIKHIIVMLLRMFAIAALVFAFAGPNFNNKTQNKSAQNITGIYIDNSFSMESSDRNGRLFDHAVAGAREIIKHSSRESKFFVFDNKLKPGQRLLNKDEALSKIDNMGISSVHKEISTIIDDFLLLKSKNKKENGLTTYLFSDFQKSSFNAEEFPADSTTYWNFALLQHQEIRNILIDSCWIEDPIILPSKTTTLFVKLKNVSNKSYEKAGIKLFINDKNKSIASVDLLENSEKIIEMQFNVTEKGWQSAYLEVEDYPITFDDILYFSFFVDEKINVLAINPNGNDNYLKAFYLSDSVFNFSQENFKSINYQNLKDNQLIILNGLSEISSGLSSQLNTYVNDGGNLMIFPPENDNIADVNKLLKIFDAGSINGPQKTETRVKGIKLKNSIFSKAIDQIPENANLPIVFQKFNFTNNYTNKLETLISLINGEAFLLKKEIGSGNLYFSAVSLNSEFSNLPSHPLFIPLMYGMAVEGKGFQKLFYTIGKNNKIDVNIPDNTISNRDDIFNIKMEKSDQSFIPLQQMQGNKLSLSINNNIEQAATYLLKQKNENIAFLSFNYERKESIMEFYNKNTLKENLKQSKLKNYDILDLQTFSTEEIIDSMQNESRLWLVFIIFALSFLFAEVLVLRFWP